ncbi:bifunctional serine/threonine-protein kinase/formylglycine-generating enzyme family protein [Singulisphaera sp. Ch08]|uniref:Bifunctional serine/threonine-protein kinase/formylglycine-generating enzyme family protein n=1 Tax=Singulisphaera sp. Ch08 TaxID=3120278 RepID=A0AAU7CCN5_9BACT
MADRRELPDEARVRRTSHVPPTDMPTTQPAGPPFVEMHPSEASSGSLPPTRTQEPPTPSTGATLSLYATPRMDDPRAAIGSSEQVRILFGKYLVVRKLGEGAMGEVWLVRHRDLGAERALKLINLGRFSDPEMRARARREARAMGLFSHPNAVAVHDANADGDLAYIEMEYIRGRSLNKVLEPGVPMPLDWVARMVEQLCAVLEVAHAHGIVHRDLKPSNMMLLDSQPEGREHLKILDFGIAKILHADEQGHEDLQTRSGATIGTPAYMSPEQINSEANQIDGRSDLYSVGVILFEMLTGRRPFTSASFKLTYDHLHTPPPCFSEVNATIRIPEAVEKLVLRCLDKDPALRPQSARELGDEFRRLATPPKPPEPIATPLPTRRGLLGALLLVAGLAIGIAVWVSMRPHPFNIHAAQPDLSLPAGGSATITILAEGDRPKHVDYQADVTPPGISVTKAGGKSSTGVQQFALAIGPNVVPGVTVLSFRAHTGTSKFKTNVRLTVEAPKVELPDDFVPAPGSVLIQDHDRIFHSQIFKNLGDNAKVEFLFIKRNQSDEPASFYIMKDKISNRVFARFAAKEPKLLKGTAWRMPPGKGQNLPAFNVTAEEACRFAHWLGRDRAKVRLPRVEQWDKASGCYDVTTQQGPFVEPWKPGDLTIAVGRDSPAPVGSSSHDLSPLGCRDMAGNGMEWTRNSTIEGKMLPFPEGSFDPVLLRGRSFKLSSPLLYKDLRDVDERMNWDADKGESDIGFRLVIDDL